MFNYIDNVKYRLKNVTTWLNFIYLHIIIKIFQEHSLASNVVINACKGLAKKLGAEAFGSQEEKNIEKVRCFGCDLPFALLKKSLNYLSLEISENYIKMQINFQFIHLKNNYDIPVSGGCGSFEIISGTLRRSN